MLGPWVPACKQQCFVLPATARLQVSIEQLVIQGTSANCGPERFRGERPIQATLACCDSYALSTHSALARILKSPSLPGMRLRVSILHLVPHFAAVVCCHANSRYDRCFVKARCRALQGVHAQCYNFLQFHTSGSPLAPGPTTSVLLSQRTATAVPAGRKHGGHSRHQAVRQVELRRCGGAAAPHAVHVAWAAQDTPRSHMALPTCFHRSTTSPWRTTSR